MNHTESIVWRSAINDCPPLYRRLGTCSSRQKAPRRRARARKRRQQTHICRGHTRSTNAPALLLTLPCVNNHYVIVAD